MHRVNARSLNTFQNCSFVTFTKRWYCVSKARFRVSRPPHYYSQCLVFEESDSNSRHRGPQKLPKWFWFMCVYAYIYLPFLPVVLVEVHCPISSLCPRLVLTLLHQAYHGKDVIPKESKFSAQLTQAQQEARSTSTDTVQAKKVPSWVPPLPLYYP